MIARSKLTAANSSAIALLPQAGRMLEKAVTIEEIRKVENLAQLAREYAKAAGLGREAINTATRHGLDARRKMGTVLKTMRERGELAERGKRNMSQRATFILEDLGLTRSQSSRYQQEARVPQDVYEKWVRAVMKSDDRMLTAAGLRALGRRQEAAYLPLAVAAARLRRLIFKLAKRMSDDDRARLPKLLGSLLRQLKRKMTAGPDDRKDN